MVDSAYFVKSTHLRAFIVRRIFSTLHRYVADMLKMCMIMFDAEKIFFDKLIVLLT